MANPEAGVSAHLHIRRDGSITRMVGDRRRAWHAGDSSWPGVGDVNSESLGWEIGNDNDGEPYSDAQYEAVADLLRHYLPQGLPREAVVSHKDVAPGRKTDPHGWDWNRMWRLLDPEPVITIPAPAGPGYTEPVVAPVSALRTLVRAAPDEPSVLERAGELLGPVLGAFWRIMAGRIRERVEAETDKALDRILGQDSHTP